MKSRCDKRDELVRSCPLKSLEASTPRQMKKERQLTFDDDYTRDTVSLDSKDVEMGRLSLAPAVYRTSIPRCKYLEKRQQYDESVRVD